MRVRILGAELASAMKYSVAAKNGPLPILQHALLEAEDDWLRITTTDHETTTAVTIEAEVKEPGRVCATAALFASSPALGTELHLEEKDGRLHVKGAGRNTVRIPTLHAAEFPIPDADAWKLVDVDPVALCDAINTVAYAAGKNDVRYYLNVVHVARGAAEAADGYRAAVCPLTYDGPELMIPAARAASIARMLDETSIVEVIDGRKVRVRTGRVCMEVKMVDGRFPDLARLMPQRASDESFSVRSTALVRSASSIGPFARSEAISVYYRVTLRATGKQVSITDKDDNVVGVDDCDEFAGELAVGLNLDFLRQAAEASGGVGSRIVISKHDRSVLFAASDRPDRHLVMGMQ